MFLWPVDFSLEGYKTVFAHKLIGAAYRNTLFYTSAGTAINVTITVMCAYPLARNDFPMRKFFSVFFRRHVFQRGMIPTYMVVSNLKLTNTIWAMLLPGAHFRVQYDPGADLPQEQHPQALLEVSQIDGC